MRSGNYIEDPYEFFISDDVHDHVRKSIGSEMATFKEINMLDLDDMYSDLTDIISKIDEIECLMETDRYEELDRYDKTNLVMQLAYMNSYRDMLTERVSVAEFKNQKEK
jgi:hypothetical protein